MTSQAVLRDLCSTLKDAQLPAALSDERVWHFSIPAFDESGSPDLVHASTIGSSKLLVTRPCILFSRLNPRIPRVWDLTAPPSDYKSLASSEFVPFVIRDQSRLDSRYLYWFLQSKVFVAKARAGVRAATKSRERVEKERLFDVPIPLPALAEQRRIAAVLDKVDGIRRKRREGLRLLDELLRSAFLEMFGDPVKNAKGWPLVKLEDCLLTRPTIGTITPASDSGEFKLIRVGELGQHDVATDRCARVSIPSRDLLRFEAREADLLLARAIGSEQHLGKASVLQAVWEPVVFDSHVMRLRCKPDRLHASFLWQWLQTSGGRRTFLKHGGRTAVQFNINAAQVSDVRLPLPPIEEQGRFLSMASRVRSAQSRLSSALGECDTLFESLAQRAFRGEL